ncbi:hypothetical protein BABINDRAFT_38066 [Babjeviella inositovora NRRL Y-12698]|uniref:Mitochondrial outer membrane protein OM14 C-terminal domain-containing protein n=1 Tax=Babjeviella inositovora NRRL Y-12698 TaxID=984486 RepID=A0A1E3QQD4_9ASCO|nr:uncharacterized protein BABINDRAFT_38066 [Babjeviella inositovora NRRL Y-12698]ODQ79292.1 hypothetical protein BABINDRAFT_38066 [Babjeviella inositovora NRRL Y-12698]
MSYAEAAASSGPVGIKEPIPAPVEVENTPSKAIPSVTEEDIKKEAKELKDRAVKEAKNIDAKVRKEVKHIERDTASVFQSVKNYTANSPENKKYLNRVQTELQNPVVITQLVVAVLGAAASCAIYHERGRILSDHKIVLAYHHGIVGGLLALDVLLFNTFYPKYDKKRL